MMKLKEIEKVTYNLIKTNSTFSLIGLDNEIKLLDNDYQIKKLTIRIMENQLKKRQRIFYIFFITSFFSANLRIMIILNPPKKRKSG